jgi:DNA-binding transcriptional MocR family regulator
MPPTEVIDLRLNYPTFPDHLAELADALLGQDAATFGRALRQAPYEGPPVVRAAAAAWLGRPDRELDVDDLLVCAGGHHGVLVALLASGLTGESLAVDTLTYPGLLGIADLLHIRLVPCEGDESGMQPDALQRAAREGVRAVYLMPTVHNPLGLVMPTSRREEIVAVSRERQLTLVEDDAYGFLEDTAPPSFAHLAPERAFYIYSLSKILAPGVKTSFLVVPPALRSAAQGALRLTTSGGVPVFGDTIARWLEDGTVARWIAEKRMRAVPRQARARAALSDLELRSHPTSYHIWVEWPGGRSTDDVHARLLACGVDVVPATAFTPPRHEAPDAIRVALGGEHELERLDRGLAVIAEELARRP